ncbi:hypothetical protein AB6813_14175 [bacterium RCC_150]
MCVLSIGQMNLAVGRMAAVGAMASGACYQFLGMSLLAGAVVGLVVGGLLGLLAGWIIVRSHVNAFVVTLALDFALLGLVTLVYTALTENAAFSTKPEGMDLFRNGSFADVCAFGYCGPRAIPCRHHPLARNPRTTGRAAHPPPLRPLPDRQGNPRNGSQSESK